MGLFWHAISLLEFIVFIQPKLIDMAQQSEPSIPTHILYPINLQALCVAEDGAQFVQREQDFSNLYSKKNKKGHPPLGAYVVNTAFEGAHSMAEGIHLHWALPDTINQIYKEELPQEQTVREVIPEVPNRWLITRLVKKDGIILTEKSRSWIVESDYLIHPDNASNYDFRLGATIPFKAYEKGNDCPYRYIGKVFPFEEWNPTAAPLAKDEYIDELTTLGFGQIHYSAFYPNCDTVFGFHDQAPPLTPEGQLGYSLIGWYDNPKKDWLHVHEGQAHNHFVKPLLQLFVLDVN